MLRIVGGLSGTRVEQFHFADGRIITIDQITDRLLLGTAGDDRLIGFDNRNDTIAGGAGSDAMEGGGGDDTYRFGYGDGRDSIAESYGLDRIEFGAGITRDKVTFAAVDGNLLISLSQTGDQLVVLSGVTPSYRQVESFVFSGGQTMSLSDLLAELRAKAPNGAQETYNGVDYGAAETILPGAGFDRIVMTRDTRLVIESNGGIDRVELPWSVGEARITITGYGSAAAVVRLAGPSQDDLLISFPKTGDQILLVWAMQYGELPPVVFADGVTWDRATLLAKAMAAQTSSESDLVIGSALDDTIDPGTGDDEIRSGDGNDTVLFTRGDGRDVIYDSGGVDRLKVTGYQLSDLRVTRPSGDRNDLLLSFGDGVDQVFLRSISSWSEDRLTFSDGTVLTTSDLLALTLRGTSGADQITGYASPDVITGNAGNDTLTGGFDADTLIGGPGDDVLDGGESGDTYVWRRGDGNDILAETGWWNSDGDTLRLEGVLANEVSFRRTDQDLTLVIASSAAGAGGSVRLVNVDTYSVESVRLDNAVWTQDNLRAVALAAAATPGNDRIAGFSGNDSLVGGAGNDWLSGGNGGDSLIGGVGDDTLLGGWGDDVYSWSRGDGNDILDEADSGGADQLVLTEVLARDVSFTRIADSIRLNIAPMSGAATGGSVTLVDFAAGGGSGFGTVEKIVLKDATWTADGLRTALLQAAATTGNDLIAGFGTDDSLRGGRGDDVLVGGAGNDTYSWARGDGNDLIEDNSGASDRLVLENIAAGAVSFRLAGNDLAVTITPTSPGGTDGGRLVLRNFLGSPIDSIQIGSTVLTSADVLKLISSATGAGTYYNDGTWQNDVISGGIGNDWIFGRGGDDSLSGNAGDDRIFGNDDNSYYGMDWYIGDADTLIGGAGDDTLDGGLGLDVYTWKRGDGNDLIDEDNWVEDYFDPETGYTSFMPSVDFDLTLEGVNRSDVTLGWADNDLILRIAASTPGAADGGSIVIKGVGYDWQGYSTVHFANDEVTGSQLWELAKLQPEAALRGTSGADTLRGGAAVYRLIGDSGNDTYSWSRGSGNKVIDDGYQDGDGDVLVLENISQADVRVTADLDHIILTVAGNSQSSPNGGKITLLNNAIWSDYSYGVETIRMTDAVWTTDMLLQKAIQFASTSDNDVIFGFYTNDSIRGGAGDDTLLGGSGDDIYVWDRGDGDDLLIDNVWRSDSVNADILILPSVSIGQVRFEKSGSDVKVVIAPSIIGGGDGGSVTLQGLEPSGSGGYNSIEWLQVGSLILNAADVWSRAVASSGSGNGTVTGTAGNDSLTGSASNDSLSGNAGNDWVSGGRGADWISGGTGNDTLTGDDDWSAGTATESDTYVWTFGDGNDVIIDRFGAADVLSMTDVEAAKVTVRRAGQDFTLVIAASSATAANGGSITLVNFADGSSLETIRLKDAVWDGAALLRQLLAAQVTSGNDNIVGFSGADSLQGGAGDDWLFGQNGDDTLVGGAGNDVLSGGWGSDSYVWSRGSGNDMVYEYGGSGTIVVLQGIAATALSFQRSGDDTKLVIAPSSATQTDGGSITLTGVTLDAADLSIAFDGGLRWSAAEIRAKILAAAATSGSETIFGFAGNDTLSGGRGDDTLKGGAGDDTYRFTRGDGADVIEDAGGSQGVLEIYGYARSDVSFTRRGVDGSDLIIRLADRGDEITLINGLDDGRNSVRTVKLMAPGVTLSIAEIRAGLLRQGTPADDILFGTGGDDTLSGGRGNDLLQGGAGNDSFLYSAGDGDDRMGDSFGSEDVLKLLDYRVQDVRTAVRGGPDSLDLVIRLAGDGDRILLEGALGTDGVDNIRFADGTVWNKEAMRQRALADIDTSGDDNVVGFDGGDVMVAKGGNDVMAGGWGSDSYRYARGSGADTVREGMTGSLDADVLTFIGIKSTEVSAGRLFRGSDTVVLRIAGSTTDSVTVMDALASDGRGIESYVFSDGITWDKAKLRQLLDNVAPVASPDGYFTVVTGQSVTIAPSILLRNDFDSNGDALRIIAVDGGADGQAQIAANGDVVFTARSGFTGPTKFTYTLSDGRNGLATGNVNLQVRPVAEARDDYGYTVDEDAFLVVRTERLLSNDGDGDRMIIASVYGAVNGNVSLASNGEISFNPTPDFNGAASFIYVANTPEGGRAEAKVYITVAPVNDAPVAAADGGFRTLQGSSLTIDPAVLLANDRDIDGDSLSILSVISSPNTLAVLNPSGQVVVTPNASFFGAGYFDYVAKDPSGAISTARVSLEVTPTNRVPEPQNDRFTALNGETIREDNPVAVATSQLLANDIERDAGQVLRVVAVGNAIGGMAQLLQNETVLFTPAGDFNGEAGFDYTVDDGHGGTATARATLVFAAVNDNPAPGNDSYTKLAALRGLEDRPLEIAIADLMANDTDIEDGRAGLTFQSVSNVLNGSIQVTGRGTLIFTPTRDFWGETSFTYLVTDRNGAAGAASVTLFLENVGDAPPVAVTDNIDIYEDVPTVIPIAKLLGNDTDIDRDPIYFVSARPDPFGGTAGTISYNAAGDIVFTPHANVDGPTFFYYTVTDRRDGSSEGRVRVNIIAVPDDPTVVNDDGGQTPLNVPLVLRVADLIKNDYDVDDIFSGPRAVSFVGVDSVSTGSYEIVTVAGETFVALTTPLGFTGDVSLRYRIRDAINLQDDGLVTAKVLNAYSGLLTGTDRTDLLIGQATGETINGLAGHDLIRALAGHDTVTGGAGNDTVDGGLGDDVIDGGDGADSIDGGAGLDTVSFATSNTGVRANLTSRVGQGGYAEGDTYLSIENLTGSDYADTLVGDGNANRLDGGDGHDSLEGAAGADRLTGGRGNDTLKGGAGADTLDGGDGSDTASYEFATSALQVSLAAGTVAGGEAQGDVLIAIENLIGGDLADRLEGNAGANLLSGGQGADTLIGGDGDDMLIGGRGADVLTGGAGVDTADYALSTTGVTIDMVTGAAGAGDAQGDSFSGIEIIQGSYYNDTIRGDGNDNVLRGRLGADVLDGRGGRDTADYSQAETAISIDLQRGGGLTGEATGDTLISIEVIRGSNFADTLLGDASDTSFDGGLGNDLLGGRGGSDSYVFGFGSGEDTISEAGDAAGTDRVLIGAAVLPKDVSVLREGNDLVVELERAPGVLNDMLRVKDHFLSREAGIEEIVFANGTLWDRAKIEAMLRAGRFNAEDDVIRLGTEDVPVQISAAALLANDSTNGAAGLTIISVGNGRSGTPSLNGDGSVTFLGARDFNGKASFSYTARDAFGRESTADVEVQLIPVNDAPIARDDGPFTGTEDQVLRIAIADLLRNDDDVDFRDALSGERLSIVDLGPLLAADGTPLYVRGATWKLTNGKGDIGSEFIEFTPYTDHFGFAGFTYTLRDSGGLEARGRVERNFTPVNDAPRGGGGLSAITLDASVVYSLKDLMGRVYDIEGDAVSFTGLKGASNGAATYNAAAGTISFNPAALGASGFTIGVIDARGAAADIGFTLDVVPSNQPPRAGNDGGFVTLEDRVLVIDPKLLLLNDSDPNGDQLSISALERFPLNGRVAFLSDGLIAFTPRADFNGAAGFRYTITDGKGGTAEAFVSITIMPDNDAPVLRDDVVTGLEDTLLTILAADAFGNDMEPDGDVIFFHSATILGVMAESYISGPMTVSASLQDGTALPGWLSFNAASLTFTGTPPAGFSTPLDLVVRATYADAGRSFVKTLSIAPADAPALQAGLQVDVNVPSSVRVRSPFAAENEFDASDMGSALNVRATLANGAALPQGVSFDPLTLTLKGSLPASVVSPFSVLLTFTTTDPLTGSALTRTGTITVNPAADRAALASGIAYDSDIAVLAMNGGSFSARLANGRALPDWLSFNAETMQLARTGVAPPADAGLVRLQIVYTPSQGVLPAGVYAASKGGFALEFLLDPTLPLDPAINALLANDRFFAAQGKFGIDLSQAAGLAALKESGAPLPSWLKFDAEELAFSGTPPATYVGAVPVRLEVTGKVGGLPSFAIISDVVVDQTFSVQGASGFGARVEANRINLTAPEDFNGALVVAYKGVDEKGAVSAAPAIVVVNVLPMPERPDAGADSLSGTEDTPITVSLAALLANDRDDDGDPIRIIGFGQPANGKLQVVTAGVDLAPPAKLPVLAGGVYSATLASGEALPAWLTINAQTGRITGQPPLDYRGTLSLAVTVASGATRASATLDQAFDGNLGAKLVYTPNAGHSGADTFTYTLTDDRQGPSQGVVTLSLASVNDPPVAANDVVAGIEDTALDIRPTTLLANDRDVDGDPLTITGVANAVNGTVSFVNGVIRFTPTTNFDGAAGFDYTVSDGTDGSSTASVRVNIASTNRAPVAVADVFTIAEDTPLIITASQLLQNDSDPDREDQLRFLAISGSGVGIRTFIMPDGRIQFVPDENRTGPVSVTYQVTDGRLASSASVTLNVTPVNDAPVANADAGFTALQDQPLTIAAATLMANDRDVEGNGFRLVAVQDADNGTVALVGGNVVFTPRAGYVGNAAFQYVLEDSLGARSLGSVSLTVQPTNHLPTPVSDSGFTVSEDGFIDINPADLLANDTDLEGNATIRFLGLDGAVKLANGFYRVTPAPDVFGKLTLTYRITDQSGLPVTGTVTIDVTPLPDAPVAVADSLVMHEDTPFLFDPGAILGNDRDPDGESVIFSRVVAATGLSLAQNEYGQFVITTAENVNGAASFDYEIRDFAGATAQARVAVTVRPVNDAPVLADAIANYVTPASRAVLYTLPAGQFRDVDGTALSLSARLADGTALPAWLTFNAQSGTFSGTAPTGFAGNLALRVTASDGQLATSGTFVIAVLPALTISGTAGADSLTGTAGNDSLLGLAGNDTLQGGAGIDNLIGGAGNDSYVVDTATDVIFENANDGLDTVQSSVSYVLGANLENLQLTGALAIDGTGNAQNNLITGNSGRNRLDGGAGSDTMAGGGDDDTYVVDSAGDVVQEAGGGGTDTVIAAISYTLGDTLENLVLSGRAAINATGNAGSNRLTGNAGANILDGGGGDDVMAGGAGNDIYIVDQAGDVVQETAGNGLDTVRASFSYRLGDFVENLELGGTAASGTGNALANAIFGNGLDNSLDGAGGTDTLAGGGGNDTYYVDLPGDVVIEQRDAGIDTVIAASSYALSDNIENLTLLGGAQHLSGTGNDLNNRLTGNAGNNLLDGRGGADTLEGGGGNDTYVVDSLADVVIEAADGGADTVRTSVTYTLGDTLEDLELTGSANIDGTGNAAANTLTGNAGRNVLRGLGGDDTYIVDSRTDVVIEAANAGLDTVFAADSFVLGDNVENLVLMGMALNATGNRLANVLTGNDQNNQFDGISGEDTMFGGAGDDIYVVNSARDLVVEDRDRGNDTVWSTISYALTDNVENLVLRVAAAGRLTGNALNNMLTGNAGSDVLDGGVGNDTMAGGSGDDLYYVDREGDVVVEALNAGQDRVIASVSHALSANVETLVLTGSAAISGTGNALANSLTGNAGDNILSGGGGDDTIDGGAGSDTLLLAGLRQNYVLSLVDASTIRVVDSTGADGTDTLRNVENVTFADGTFALRGLIASGVTGTSGNDSLTGTIVNDVIRGLEGNDTLDGAAGADRLEGGTGDDTYRVDDVGDLTVERAGEGTDTVRASVSYTLMAEVENLVLEGQATSARGNALRNALTGNALANMLDGAAGADTLSGGAGNDLYIVDDAGDLVVEASTAGLDTVQSSVTHTLAVNVENLVLTGEAAINGTGNLLSNMLTGNKAANTLDGGRGADTLLGGEGDDTYVVDVAGDVVWEDAGQGLDTVKSTITYALGANVENLELIGNLAINGTGNGLANRITGGGGANIIDGGLGADTMAGGGGNDTYIVADEADVVIEQWGQGTDTVRTVLNYTLGDNVENLVLSGVNTTTGTGNTLHNQITGNSGNNILTGLAGNDTLDGGSGIDRLVGGTGNDTYIIDTTIDTLVENVNEGIDTVQSSVTYVLGDNLDNLTLTGTAEITGTGNALANTLTGNAANNLLTGGAGNDRLDGGGGLDRLVGGTGNDTYVVDTTTDVLVENANEGIDTVNASVSFELGANFENLTLTGGAAINGTGNGLDNVLTGNGANNILYGGAGNDRLNGGGGIDMLRGGLGDDAYTVDTGTDSIIEYQDEGIDTVTSSVTYMLGENLENLALSGAAAIDGTGNQLANLITGNGASNRLAGLGGNDTIDGGAGTDRLVLSGVKADYLFTVVSATQVRVTDSVAGRDGTDLITGIELVVFSDSEASLASLLEINGTAGNDALTGSVINDTINGLGGNDTLDGGLGLDRLLGGAGDDTYNIGNPVDTVVENPNDGNDTVRALVSYMLGDNVENLILTGTAAITGTGNGLNNVITGNNAANILDGRGGNDLLTGGGGADRFLFAAPFGDDRISDFWAGAGNTDLIQLSLGPAYDSYSEVRAAASQVNADTVFNFGALGTLTLQNVALTAVVADDFLFA